MSQGSGIGFPGILGDKMIEAFDRLAGATELAREVSDRVDRIPADLNSFGYDPWGYNPDVVKRALLPAAWLYRYWFRCKVRGIENMPEGRVLVIGNHAGQI